MESGSRGRGHAASVGVRATCHQRAPRGTCLEVTHGGVRSDGERKADGDGTCLLEAYSHCIHRILSLDHLSSDPDVMGGTFLLHSLLIKVQNKLRVTQYKTTKNMISISIII